MGEQNRARIRTLLQRPFNWELLIELAFMHRVLPLVFRSLSLHAAPLIPPTILAELRHHCQVNINHNLRMTAELLRLLNLFEAHQIRSIPYKGPLLATTLYGDLALRQFSDLDLLIETKDVSRAKDLLLSNGYRFVSQWTEVPAAAHPRAVLRYHWEYAFVLDDDVHVELHCLINAEYRPFGFDFEMLWGRREQISIADTTVSSLCPEDLFLMLHAHGTKHFWARLQWLCDISELLRTYPHLDWNWISRQPQTINDQPMFFAPLRVARELLDVSIPAWLLQQRKASLLTRFFAAIVKGQLLHVSGEPDFEKPERVLYTLCTMTPWRQRVWYSLRVARWVMCPTAEEGPGLPFPGCLFFLNFLLRLSWLSARCCGLLLRDFKRFNLLEERGA